MSPYRRPAELESPPSASGEDESRPDGDLWPVFLVFWLGSVVRVAVALARREHFGTEASLALLAIVLVPVLWFRPDSVR